jgi:hypothetical protein
MLNEIYNGLAAQLKYTLIVHQNGLWTLLALYKQIKAEAAAAVARV